jgi:hypothetical protein
MIAATTLGILIIPTLYYFFQRMVEKWQTRRDQSKQQTT